MARTTYIQDPVTHKLIPKDEYYGHVDVNAPMVIGDIQPYQSMVDGTMITSRSQHKAHLKQHNLIEVGNETQHLFKSHEKSQQEAQRRNDMARREMIADQVYRKLRY